MNWLFLAVDPGGINAILPIYEFVKSMNDEATFYVPMERLQYAKNANASIRAIDMPIGQGNCMSIKEIIRGVNPDILITGTSGLSRLELHAWDCAREEGILSIAILDFWGNYKQRFKKQVNQIYNVDDTVNESDCVYPEYIFAMNKQAKDEMIRQGIPHERIIVTGNPHFIALSLKRDLLDANSTSVVLMSEPLDSLYRTQQNYGFDEYSVLKIVRDWQVRTNLYQQVSLKAHPKQVLDFTEVFEGFTLDKSSNGLEVILKSKIVMGTLTTALIEALILGKYVCSIIPNPDFNKYSPLHQLGFSLCASNVSQIEWVLRNQPSRDDINKRFGISELSIGQITNLIRRLHYDKISN